MPSGRKIKLPGLRAYTQAVGQTISRKAAEQIVKDLIELGPWYSGQFAKNWVVRVGDVRIPATVDSDGMKGRTRRTEIPLPLVPSLRGTGKSKTGYTIGNRTTYRNQAMDLIPGRVENASVLSAPKDWYRTYVEGRGLRNALGFGAEEAAKSPEIRGFKASNFIGPAARVVR